MILKGILWSWALLAPCVVAEQQKPLGAGIPKHEHLQQDSWRRGLNFSSPAPHLFASAYGLLQQWSNTVFPNGHTMAAVEIPAFTLLYHGRMDEEDAPSPEWLAFDIEMAYGIMGSTRQSFMLSYQTTRPVKALYFDGESAALMGLGQLDTQMLHLYGNVTGPDSGGGMWRGRSTSGRWGCVTGLRNGASGAWAGSRGWGNVTAPQMREVKAEGVDENGDDGNGVGEKKGGGEVKGSVPTSVYPLPPQPTRTDRPVSPTKPAVPPNWRGIMGPSDREPFLQSQGWGWFSSGTWHYGGSGMGPGRGEVEVYGLRDHKLVFGQVLGVARGGGGSVAMNELGRRRRLHHLEGVSEQAAARVRGETEAMLRDVLEGGRCSGMVWVDVFAEIVQRNAGHLMALEKAARWAGDEGNVTEVREWLDKLRGQSHMFLVSFLEYPNEIDRATWDVQGPLFGETYSRCRYRYIRLLVDIPMKPWETDLRDAAEEVMGGICGVLLEVGFEVERAWYALEEGAGARLVKLAERWEDSVRGLRAWVGWEGEFIRCDKVCEWDERCYIPMWPLLKSVWGGRRPRPPPRDGPGNGTEPRPGPPPGKGRGPGYGGGHRGPGYGMPGRGPSWMGDETDLWAPKCVKMDDIMPRPRAD
uniref:Uncharacterized protein n=1 Tax=Colletotrichum fructicola (strain Nara gc5) TaxID=1213859 RepID=L2G4F4_COLFN